MSQYPEWESGLSPIRRYFFLVSEILAHPTLFFKKMAIKGGISGPLAFALITHWLGAAIGFIWHSVLGGAIFNYADRLFKIADDAFEVDHPGRTLIFSQTRDQILHWFWGAGSIIADPFITLTSILFAALLVYIGARILITPGKNQAPSEITFESSLRIICFGMTPAILAALPIVGGGVASLYSVVVTVIGAREVYRIDWGRAILVALFPKLLFLGILFLGVFFIAAAILKLVAAVF